ncbi:MAG: hypothetical protein ACLSG4_04330, partial [Anaerobutyricum sp.]
TDTSLFLTTYRGGSHLPANIYADNQFMKNYLEHQNTFDEEAFIVADSAYSGEENSQIAALDFQKLLDYIKSSAISLVHKSKAKLKRNSC